MSALSAVIILASLATTAGAKSSPVLSDLKVPVLERLEAIEQARAIEVKSPDKAAKAYHKLVEPAAIESIDEYRERLKVDLEGLSKNSRSGLRPESIAAFPHWYDRRLESAVEARHGLARVAAGKGDASAALAHAQAALDLLTERAISPVFLARRAKELYSLLERIYAKNGAEGQRLLARLNRELLEDYLASKQGFIDFALERQSYWDFEEQAPEIDLLVWDVNGERFDRFYAKMDRIVGALSALSAAGNTMMARQAAARGDSAGAMNYQFNARLAQFQSQALAARAAGQKVGLASFMNTVALPTLGAQLGDPNMGKNAPDIVKSFVNEAAKTGGPELQAGATAVTRAVEQVLLVRSKGDEKKTADALGQFAQELTKFQAKVQELK